MVMESTEEAMGLAQKGQKRSEADPERVREELDQRAAAEWALFEEDADNQLHPSEVQGVKTSLDRPEPTHSPQKKETIEISSGANDQPKHSTETNPNFETQGATPPAQSWVVWKTASQRGRPHRPLGIKATRDDAKQRQSKATFPPGIGETQVDKTASHRKVARTRRASKVITQMDFRAWTEQNHAVGGSQTELRGAKRPRPLGDKVEEVCIRPRASNADLASSNQTKRLRSIRQQNRDEQISSNTNKAVQQVLPPAPITGQRVGSGTQLMATPAGTEVTITFRAYERGEWMTLATIPVDASDPHEAQKVADRYARVEDQNARFYDRSLRKVSVNQCVRAAIDSGTYTVLMSLGKELYVTRQLIASVARLFDEGLQTPGVTTDDEL
ncbi:uncharacterized protein BO80DRAFT_441141 [Aspergillus ibericus CBS 121593]|uniref:Uncharacterized protein n=1 Tax=Aspergillus ibericus CBS 121593 TaxID=1448316 RepID=A0A395HAC8_9EURO|nr:hypothetical protein BO80DRAFT_441141 [Aspergillus ibericus CBS 121593]RAL04901.1 hypothetical protein BO80DRAFT_441141 [Aspergillus ibericus CBS 121593]